MNNNAPNKLSTEEVQFLLDLNQQYIFKIMNLRQQPSKKNECEQLTKKLQTNLLILASFADSQFEPPNKKK